MAQVRSDRELDETRNVIVQLHDEGHTTEELIPLLEELLEDSIETSIKVRSRFATKMAQMLQPQISGWYSSRVK